MQRIFFGLEGGDVRVYRNHEQAHLIGNAMLFNIGHIYRGTDNQLHFALRPDKPDRYISVTLQELSDVHRMMDIIESSDNKT